MKPSVNGKEMWRLLSAPPNSLVRKTTITQIRPPFYVCEKCGTVPCVNPGYGVSCKMCLDKTRVYAIDTTWSAWVFMNEMQAMFGVRIEIDDLDFPADAQRVEF
jgi:hypothetical protein